MQSIMQFCIEPNFASQRRFRASASRVCGLYLRVCVHFVCIKKCLAKEIEMLRDREMPGKRTRNASDKESIRVTLFSVCARYLPGPKSAVVLHPAPWLELSRTLNIILAMTTDHLLYIM